MLETKATYYTASEDVNDIAIEAFRVLALEMPEKYASHPIHLDYLDKTYHHRYRQNPYHQIVK